MTRTVIVLPLILLLASCGSEPASNPGRDTTSQGARHEKPGAPVSASLVLGPVAGEAGIQQGSVRLCLQSEVQALQVELRVEPGQAALESTGHTVFGAQPAGAVVEIPVRIRIVEATAALHLQVTSTRNGHHLGRAIILPLGTTRPVSGKAEGRQSDDMILLPATRE